MDKSREEKKRKEEEKDLPELFRELHRCVTVKVINIVINRQSSIVISH